VLDETVLELFASVPREDFVPEAYKAFAFADTNIPLSDDQVMMTPKEEAHIIQAVKVKSNETVLEIGTGSGYVTALLAKQAKHVYSVDLDPDFIKHAQKQLKKHDIDNVTIEKVNGSRGWDKHEPYDVIVATGSLPILPPELLNSLNIGGRLFAVVGQAPAMSAQLHTRIAEDQWETQTLFETVIPPLANAPEPEPFQF